MSFFRAAILFTALSVFLAAPCPADAAQGLGARAAASSSPAAAPSSSVAPSTGGADLSKMPIEDAIMLVFQQISEDARKDMKDIMSEMEATRLKRQKLREEEQTLKDDIANLRDKAKADMMKQKLSELHGRQAALDEKQRRVLAALQQRQQAEEETLSREQRAALRRERAEQRAAEERREREQRAAARRAREERREAEEQQEREQRAALRRERAERRAERDAEERRQREARAAARRERAEQRETTQEDVGKGSDKDNAAEPATAAKPAAPSPCPSTNPNCLKKPVGTFQTTTPTKTIGQMGGLGSASSSTTTTNKAAPVQLPHGSLTPSPVKPVSPLLKPGTSPNPH